MQLQLFTLLVAIVTLSRFDLGFGVLPDILAQRAPDIVAFFEGAVFVAPHITLVGSGINQFPFAFCGHDNHLTESAYKLISMVFEYSKAVFDSSKLAEE